MRYAMFTSGFMRHSLETAFKEAHRIGYDGIEIWGGRPHAFPKDLGDKEFEQILNWSRDYHLPIAAYTPETNGYPYNLMFTEPRMHQDAVSLVKLSMDAAREMGSPMTVISFAHSGWEVPPDAAWNHMIDTLMELTSHGEKIGMDLALEPLTPYESNMICTTRDLLRVLKSVPSTRLKAVIDLVPHWVIQEPLPDVLRLVGEKLAHLHIIDGDGSSETHLMPGDGKIPLDEFLPWLGKQQYTGFCTLELVTAYINEPALFAERALKRVRKITEARSRGGPRRSWR